MCIDSKNSQDLSPKGAGSGIEGSGELWREDTVWGMTVFSDLFLSVNSLSGSKFFSCVKVELSESGMRVRTMFLWSLSFCAMDVSGDVRAGGWKILLM